MSRLSVLALGQLLVLLDLRVNGLDLVPDPVGWAVGVVALAPLTGRHPGFVWASWACVVGAVLSVPGWVGPTTLDGATAAVVETALLLATTMLVVGVCSGLMATVPERAVTARSLRASEVGVTVLLLLSLALVEAAPEAGAVALVVVLAGVVVYVWFLVLLFRTTVPPEPSPVA